MFIVNVTLLNRGYRLMTGVIFVGLAGSLFLHGCSKRTQVSNIEGTSWSPSGQWLSIIRSQNNGSNHIMVIDVSTKKVTASIEIKGQLNLEDATWGKYSDMLYYIEREYSDTSKTPSRVLGAVDPQGKTLHHIDLPFDKVAMNLLLSPDGKTIAIVDGDRSSNTMVRFFTQHLRPLGELTLPVQSISAKWPANQPDFLLLQTIDGIQKLDIKTGSLKQLTTIRPAPRAWYYFPQEGIYFLRSNGDKCSLHRFNMLDDDAKNVVEKSNIPAVSLTNIAWSVDKNSVALVSEGCIYELQLKSGQFVRLTIGPDDSHPSYAPKGKQIAFVRNKTDLIILDKESGMHQMVYSTK